MLYCFRSSPLASCCNAILFRLLQEAAEFAFEKGDMEGMEFVISRSGPTQRSRIEPLRLRLAQRK